MESLKKNFIYNIIYQVLVVFLPLITAPYISRTLGASCVGIYSYTNSVAYYFLLVAMLGISNHGNRSIASVRDDREKLNKTFSSIYFLQITTFVISVVTYMMYISFFVSENKIIFIIQLLYVVSGLFDISWLFFGLEKFKITVTRNIIIKLGTVVCMFIFVHNPGDLWKYTLIMSIGTLFSQIYLWRYVKEYVSFVKVNIKDITKNIKPVLILFIPVLSYSIYKVMDKIMIGSFSIYSQVGFYNNAEKIINIPMGVITALGTVMLPRMSNIIANGNQKKNEQYIRISIKLVTLIASVIAFGLMGISENFAPVFFGREFYECGNLIVLLSITVFFISWANVIRTQYLIPGHKDKVYIISTIVGAVLNLIANIILIPKFQARGAAIGTIIAEFSVMFIQMIYVHKQIPVHKYIIGYMPVIIGGFFIMMCVKFIGNIIGASILGLCIQILTGGVLFFIIICVFYIVSKDEIGIMLKMMIRNIFLKLKRFKVKQ